MSIIQIIQSQCKIIIICIKDWHLGLIKFHLTLIISQYFISYSFCIKCIFQYIITIIFFYKTLILTSLANT